jgi:hypothetical protein
MGFPRSNSSMEDCGKVLLEAHTVDSGWRAGSHGEKGMKINGSWLSVFGFEGRCRRVADIQGLVEELIYILVWNCEKSLKIAKGKNLL